VLYPNDGVTLSFSGGASMYYHYIPQSPTSNAFTIATPAFPSGKFVTVFINKVKVDESDSAKFKVVCNSGDDFTSTIIDS
jgi:hypothetical protein